MSYYGTIWTQNVIMLLYVTLTKNIFTGMLYMLSEIQGEGWNETIGMLTYIQYEMCGSMAQNSIMLSSLQARVGTMTWYTGIHVTSVRIVSCMTHEWAA